VNSELASLYLALRDFVDPLRRRFESPEALESLFHRYGWIAPLERPVFDRILQVSGLTEPLDGFLQAADRVQQRLDADPAGGSLQEAEVAALVQSGTSLIRALATFDLSSLSGLAEPLRSDEFWESIGEHVLDDLLEEYLRVYHPRLFLVLRLWAVIRYEPTRPTGPFRRPYVRISLDWDQALAMVTEPLPSLKRAYHWGDPAHTFDHEGALTALGTVLRAIRVPAMEMTPALQLDPPFPPDPARRVQDDVSALRTTLLRSVSRLDQTAYKVGFEVYPAAAGSETRPSGLLVKPLLIGTAGQGLPLGDASLRWHVAADLGESIGFAVFPNRAHIVGGQPAIGTSLELASATDKPRYLLGNAGTARIELSAFSIGLSLTGSATDPEVALRLAAVDDSGKAACKVVIPLEDSDAFVQEVAKRRSLEFSFGADVRWSSKSGLAFNGRPSFDVDLPLNIQLGPVTLTAASIGLGQGPKKNGAASLAFRATVDALAKLGPVALVVEGVGFAAGFARRTRDELSGATAERNGRPAATFGTVDVSFGFKPPDGIGLSVDATVAKGGGFLRYEEANRRYGGALEVVIGNFAVKGFGLLTERPDGYSLIIVLSAEFPEPINLAFGFRLAGVGGLLALHHRLETGALQAGLRSGAASQLLFPRDPIAAAPRILTTLGAVFPPAKGQFLAGPLFKLTWGTRSLATLSVAVVLEWPDPLRLLILGTLEVTAPHRGFELLLLHAEFAGVIDFERPSFEFDAVISDSRLGPYALSGDIAVRVRGGDDALFLLTAGGFHPQFQVPTNANLPPLRRITVALSSGDNPRARLELYTAITPSTWQIGGKLELSASAAGFTAEALLSVDALFGEIREGDDTRCGFVADIEGRAAIRRGGTIIMGVDLQIQLSGTEPWHVKGKAVLHFFFFSVSIPFEGTFGDEPKRPSLPLVDAAAMLQTALEERGNWDTALPRGSGPLVTLAGRTVAADVIVAHPLGRLALRQHALPFDVEITRVGGARTSADRFAFPSVRIGTSDVAEPVRLRSPFAAGQFLDLDENERFTRPAFEPMLSGFEVSAAGTSFGAAQRADLDYEEFQIGPDGRLAEPTTGQPPPPTIVTHGVLLGAAATSTLRRDEAATRMRTSATAVQVMNVPPRVVNADTLRPVTVPGLEGAATFTEIAQGLTRHLAGGAAAEQPLAIVGAHEAHDG
jgi:hypothetical protein